MELIPLQPAHLHRLCVPGVRALPLGALLEEAGESSKYRPGESADEFILRLASPLLRPPDELLFSWMDTAACGVLWLGGGALPLANLSWLADRLEVEVFRSPDGPFAAESGGQVMLEVLGSRRGMVVDLGQTALKISWAGARRAFPRDLELLPRERGTQSIARKGAQRRALRTFIAEALRATLAETRRGAPDTILFALPSMLDDYARPAGSSYIGMSMDTQLVTHALELAGLPDVPHYLLNDAELAAASALFDERVIACGGKALVFTLGTAVGCAIADPLAAALHFAGISGERD
jgi:hypothetical protein